jgi:hypothetical protein
MIVEPLNLWSLWVPVVLLALVGAIALYFVSITDR